MILAYMLRDFLPKNDASVNTKLLLPEVFPVLLKVQVKFRSRGWNTFYYWFKNMN